MRLELQYFFAALRFFTRVPVPAWVGHDQAMLDHAVRYFSAVGILVGAVGAVLTYLLGLMLPLSIAVLLGMVATILMTGAFHEDGFADSCDGFGGGWDKSQVLAIMKDSRIGSYGAIGIGLMLLCKWDVLQALGGLRWAGLVAAHAVSRAAASSLIYRLDYVRDQEGKSKPLAQRMHFGELLIVLSFAVLPCLFLPWPAVGCGLFAAAVTCGVWARYCMCRIGGYTGDALGATQQLTELAFYLGLLCAST